MSPFGEQHCCCFRSRRVCPPPFGEQCCRCFAIWRVSLSPFGEQYCRCFCYLACQSAASRRAILPLMRFNLAQRRVSLPPFGEQHCRCDQGVSVCRLMRAILPLFLLSGVSVCRLVSSNAAAVSVQGVSASSLRRAILPLFPPRRAWLPPSGKQYCLCMLAGTVHM